MKVTFDKLTDKYKEEVMEIYNYYIENTYAAYQEVDYHLDFLIS